ncbi:DUF1045 domain-containing protein [Mesorhizobium sp. M0976]|uniref:DUF1045 domain-containing protein n=1 Tax=Mesorhizobium sp. M0976 TaxID=2957038 RepID=UPI00333C249B
MTGQASEPRHVLNYPFVFDPFHMTLTGPVVAEDRQNIVKRLNARFGRLLDEDFQACSSRKPETEGQHLVHGAH